MRLVYRDAFWVVVLGLAVCSAGEQPVQTAVGHVAGSKTQAPDSVTDFSRGALKQLADGVSTRILTIREEKQLPRLKRMHTWDMHKFCDPWYHIGPGVNRMGSNPITGTDTILVFEAHSPLVAQSELEKIALYARPNGKNGKLAIDDAHRIAVEVCPSRDSRGYRVIVGYWYSRLGVFLDSLPRGSE